MIVKNYVLIRQERINSVLERINIRCQHYILGELVPDWDHSQGKSVLS